MALLHSSVYLQSTLRESSEPLQSICYVPSSGCFITVDAQAIRLWSTKRQLRSIHWTNQERKCISANWVDALRACIILFEYSEPDTRQKRAQFEVWDINLNVLQEVVEV